MLGLAVGLALYALSGSIAFFHTPSEVVDGVVAPGARVRIGGLVKEGSVMRSGDRIAFIITDTAKEVKVSYHGIVPDLFREGQGVVAEGVLSADLSLEADNVLAKHDERYMPREAVEALEAPRPVARRWRAGVEIDFQLEVPRRRLRKCKGFCGEERAKEGAEREC